VYNKRDKEVQDRAEFQFNQEYKNREYQEKLKRERAEAVERKRAEKEAKLEATRKRQEEIDRANMRRKMQLVGACPHPAPSLSSPSSRHLQ
jgi:Ulp1 family protease